MTQPSPSSTEALWRERVRHWRDSHLTAPQFCLTRGFAPSTLRYWASRLEGASPSPKTRLLRVLPPPPAAIASSTALVVEVGSARIRVEPGFDPHLLAAVTAALRSER